MSALEIVTDRLVLRPIPADAFAALANGDADTLTALTGATFPEPLAPPPLMEDVLPFLRDRLTAHPDELGWWSWLVVERATGRATGSAGFGGRPDAEGAVVMGYATYPGFAGRGYATEAVRALVEWALEQPGVRRVCATIPPWNAASLRVAEKVGMRPVGSIWEEELAEEVTLYAIDRQEAGVG